MKKVITLSILVTVLMLSFTVVASAEETGFDVATSVSTVYENFLEWVSTYENQISAVINVVTTAILMLLFGKTKVGITDLIGKTGILAKAAAGSDQTMGKLITCNNDQVDEIKALKAEISELKEQNKKQTEVLAIVGEAVCRVAHIPATVYTNSKALPQGVRDMVNLESAETIQLMKKIESILGDKVNEDIKEG